MIIFLFILVLLCLYNMRIWLFDKRAAAIDGGIYNDYMSLEKTTSIKGAFIILVFLNHAVKYCTLSSSILDTSYTYIVITLIEQSMVAMFMLYSGYGVMLSIDKKGRDYIKSIPVKRFLRVLVHFDIAILIYIAINLAQHKPPTLINVLLSFIGWSSVGNSNWYIFVILVLYLLTYISFVFIKDKWKLGLVINIALCGVYIFAIRSFKESWWYDTVLCYALGMVYYYIKPTVDRIFKDKRVLYWVSLVILAGLTAVCTKYSRFEYIHFLKQLFFCLVVVLATMKFSINNKILQFFGKHLFSIFILQRIPMTLLSNFGLNDNKYLFVALSFTITIPISVVFDLAMDRLDLLLFKKKA